MVIDAQQGEYELYVRTRLVEHLLLLNADHHLSGFYNSHYIITRF